VTAHKYYAIGEVLVCAYL